MFDFYINQDLHEECHFAIAGIRDIYFARIETIERFYEDLNGEVVGVDFKEETHKFYKFKVKNITWNNTLERTLNGDVYDNNIKFYIPYLNTLNHETYQRIINTKITCIVVMKSGKSFLVGHEQPLRVVNGDTGSENVIHMELSNKQKRAILPVSTEFFNDDTNTYVVADYVEIDYVF